MKSQHLLDFMETGFQESIFTCSTLNVIVELRVIVTQTNHGITLNESEISVSLLSMTGT